MVTEFERATTLASKLAVKLVVSLPPESASNTQEQLNWHDNQIIYTESKTSKEKKSDLITPSDQITSSREVRKRRNRSASGGRRSKSVDRENKIVYNHPRETKTNFEKQKFLDKCHDTPLNAKYKRSSSHSGYKSDKEFSISGAKPKHKFNLFHDNMVLEMTQQRQKSQIVQDRNKLDDNEFIYHKQETKENNFDKMRFSKLSTYDNFGYDKSPDNRKQRKEKMLHNQQSFIDEQSLDTKLQGLTGNKKSSSEKRKYYPMNSHLDAEITIHSNYLVESDSDCSLNPKRRSPPTQIQSLSDDSSSTGNKNRTLYYSPESDLDLSTDDDFDQEMGKVEFSSNRGFSHEHNLLNCDKNSDMNDFLRFAVNPFVTIPDSVYP